MTSVLTRIVDLWNNGIGIEFLQSKPSFLHLAYFVPAK
jgi:hypothetical protein